MVSLLVPKIRNSIIPDKFKGIGGLENIAKCPHGVDVWAEVGINLSVGVEPTLYNFYFSSGWNRPDNSIGHRRMGLGPLDDFMQTFRGYTIGGNANVGPHL